MRVSGRMFYTHDQQWGGGGGMCHWQLQRQRLVLAVISRMSPAHELNLSVLNVSYSATQGADQRRRSAAFKKDRTS